MFADRVARWPVVYPVDVVTAAVVEALRGAVVAAMADHDTPATPTSGGSTTDEDLDPADAAYLIRALFKLLDFQNQFLAAAHVLAEASPLEAARYLGGHDLLSQLLASVAPPPAPTPPAPPPTPVLAWYATPCAGHGMEPLAALLRAPASAHRADELGRCIDGLPWLGLARAEARLNDVAGSRKAYEQVLAEWKDADADLPPLIAAKAEYARLAAPGQR